MPTARSTEQVPDEVVEAQSRPRVPRFDPDLGIAVTPSQDDVGRRGEQPSHRLVTVGDSLTHGFQSGAINNTHLSYPALIARALGIYDRFQHPSYDRFGGLPMNIEYLLRELEDRFGDALAGKLPLALMKGLDLMDEVEGFWERDAQPAGRFATRNHNLGIYGWDLYDANVRSAADCRADIETPTDAPFKQVVQNANERAALRVLAPGPVGQELLSPLGTAVALGNDGTRETPGAGDGIETLIVMLGANNALGAITELKVRWSQRSSYEAPAAKQHYTVWQPEHFRQELERVVERVRTCRARHVIWATVPHVTIAPMARGLGERSEGSRYFQYYARPWFDDARFDPDHDEHLTAADARAIDAAIDLYNAAIEDAVRAARRAGMDWRLLDVCGLLDRIASRRYIEDPYARPPWWSQYPLPQALLDLPVPPTSYFLQAGPQGRTAGGLFSLDGIHPTTVMYGLLAEEYIKVMKGAGVEFPPVTATGTTQIDFEDLIGRDSLITDPPASITGDLELIGWLDDKFGFVRRLPWRGR